jgi:broad specificity phosphatase PhoE
MTTWYIIRNAEREPGEFYHPELRIHYNPITVKGHFDSLKLYSYFSGKSIATIYASEYQRNLHTISPTAKMSGIEPALDGRLNEINNGLVGWMPDQEIQ